MTHKVLRGLEVDGVLVPGIVRPRPEGGYELVAGHRRKRASELAGKDTMPVFVRELDDDESVLIMVDSDLQREKILPSEKVFAYKMKLEAMKHQGQRISSTSVPVAQKFDILLVFMFGRIGRIADETPFVVEWFVRNGVRVWSTQEGERKSGRRGSVCSFCRPIVRELETMPCPGTYSRRILE